MPKIGETLEEEYRQVKEPLYRRVGTKALDGISPLLHAAKTGLPLALSIVALGPPTAGLNDDNPLNVSVADGKIPTGAGRHCTRLSREALEIYEGIACRENGDKAFTIPGVASEKGQYYSLVAMRGLIRKQGRDHMGTIYKCFYVTGGDLPRIKNPPKSLIAACKTYHAKLAIHNFALHLEYNCDFFGDGLQKCRSGTGKTSLSKRCPDKQLYYNFETDQESPWNVTGIGTGGLREAIPNDGDLEDNSIVSYRATIRPRGGGVRAAVVMSVNGEKPWGFVDNSCPAEGRQRRGGLRTIRVNGTHRNN